jgi:hypothetical protein
MVCYAVFRLEMVSCLIRDLLRSLQIKYAKGYVRDDKLFWHKNDIVTMILKQRGHGDK